LEPYPFLLDRVMLTGGTGFFGTAILRTLASGRFRASNLCILSRQPKIFEDRYPSLASQAKWVQGDILLPDSISSREPFTYVLHGAADSTHGAALSPTERFFQIVQGTRNMLDFAVSHGVKRFLLTSSGGVYGEPPPGAHTIPENYLGMPNPLNAKNVYSVAKRAAENLCAVYAEQYGLEVVVARCFAFVGEDLPFDVHFAMGNFIRDALWADEIVVKGDGSPTRSYLDQRDLAEWLLTLLYRGRSGEAYNVGSDEAISISELAYLVRDLISPSKSVRILGSPTNRNERKSYIPDITKIRLELGLRPTICLKESILHTAAAARNRAKRFGF
jgi:UDP-glucuronate decarboxylase